MFPATNKFEFGIINMRIRALNQLEATGAYRSHVRRQRWKHSRSKSSRLADKIWLATQGSHQKWCAARQPRSIRF